MVCVYSFFVKQGSPIPILNQLTQYNVLHYFYRKSLKIKNKIKTKEHLNVKLPTKKEKKEICEKYIEIKHIVPTVMDIHILLGRTYLFQLAPKG